MPPAKKHAQCFKKEYASEWPVLTRSMKTSSYVYCTICKSDFSIAHGGRNDCARHVDGSRHRQNAQAAAKATSRNIQTMFASSSNETLDVMKAESLFTKFIIEHNLPISVADHAGPLFKRMFPDSKIAGKYKCARTKTTELIKTFAGTTQNQLLKIIRSSKFSLSTDGSNSISNDKLFPIVIIYFDDAVGKVSTSLISLPNLKEDATGKNIYSLMENFFKENNVSWKNCIAFCADNASVMLGEHKGVSSFLKKENPNMIIHGCACHLVHLAAQRGSKKMIFDVEGFLVDVYYYFKKSSKRIQHFKLCEEECEVKDRKILKYGSTRWLSMGKVIDRFLEQWPALKMFFCEEEQGTSTTFIRLKEIFECPLTELYLLFLQSVIPLFMSTNIQLQQEAPVIFRYQKELRELFNSLIARFIKPSTIINASSVFDINFSKTSNQKEDSDIVIGGKARAFIKEVNMSSEKIEEFYSSVRGYYAEACSYIVKKFPLQNSLYEHCEIADVRNRASAKFSSIEYFMNLFYIPESDRNSIEEEFAIYQIDSLTSDILSESRCDYAWSAIAKLKDFNGVVKYKYLPSFMKNILILPHSNAGCERIFSIIKNNLTEYRSSMNMSTLEALMIEKCNSTNVPCFDSVFSEKDLKLAKQATYKALNP